MRVAEQAGLAVEHHSGEVGRPGNRAEHDLAVGELAGRVDDRRAERGQRFGFGTRAVVDRDVAASIEQPSDERQPHPADADPADAVPGVLLGHVVLLSLRRAPARGSELTSDEGARILQRLRTIASRCAGTTESEPLGRLSPWLTP